MKRILVIDESEVVRETLALILGREFSVLKRPLSTRGASAFADARDDVDLLIFGITPQLGSQVAALLHLAAQLPFSVLFLVDSKSIAHSLEREAAVGCLAKPFNPYELYQKVGQLLARRGSFPLVRTRTRDLPDPDSGGHLDFPFISRSAASLARRFAATRLPLLLVGEVGCGVDRVAGTMCAGAETPAMRFTVDAADLSEEYVAQLRLQITMQNDLLAMPMTLLIQNVDKSSLASQMRLLGLLDELAGTRENIWPITTANNDPLEKLYRGEFLEPLYYRLAILTLRLSPLRERRDEIAALAAWFARDYARKLNLSSPEFSEEAQRSLSNYLWFGNASELETVIARTLAYHRKPLVRAEDLIFDFGRDVTNPMDADLGGEDISPQRGSVESVEPKFEVYRGAATPGGLQNGHAKSVDLNVLIHELAHELKNPMVTIKTFAQLLAERYQDENFRCRFQDVVGEDIERMDDLLEMMIEYSDFAKPRFARVSLAEKVRSSLAKLHGAYAKRQARIEWRGNGTAGDVRIDEAQLEYILRNILIVVLSEARNGSEIEIDLSRRGTLSLSYLRESARMASISHYLDPPEQEAGETIFPLRVLLAKNLVERNGGRFAVDASQDEKDTLTLEFSTAERPDEE